MQSLLILFGAFFLTNKSIQLRINDAQAEHVICIIKTLAFYNQYVELRTQSNTEP